MKEKRVNYLDNLKIFLTCLVIAHHSAHAYGNIMGSWVYTNDVKNNWLYYFIVVNASFFMGLFFMISGYFIPRSYEKRGAREFIVNKGERLLFPVIFIMLIIVPSYFYIAFNNTYPKISSFFNYYINVYIGCGKFSYEHGWFIVHLFLYSCIYALIKKLFKNNYFYEKVKLTTIEIFLLAIIIGSLFCIIRFNYPTDRWIALFGVIGMEPAHLAQYVFFFAIGILAYYNNWFEQITKKQGYFFVVSGAIMAIITYLNKLILGDSWIIIWKNWGFYESFMGIFISFGLIFIFREFCNKTNKFLIETSKSAFGAYIIHTLFVVLFQVSLDKVNFPPTIKFIIVTVLSILTSFGMTYLFRKMKGLFSCGIIKRCKKIIKGRMYDGRKNRKSTRKSFKGI